jgi:beta-lactamase class D
MRIFAPAVMLFWLAAGISSEAAERVEDARLAPFFQKHGVTGVLVLYDPATNRFYSNDLDRAEKAFLPASTFKIPHALIALETGAVANSSEVIKWDGQPRGWDKWERDQTLASALKYSAVWAFQVIARRIGPERMGAWVDRLGFGNRDISGKIDSFWLDGALRISAFEQIDFLRRLYEGTLPASPEIQAEVRRLLITDSTEHYVLHGKTGWAEHPDPDLGWYVGWIERPSKVMFFALNLDMPDPRKDRHARHTIAREGLALFGFETAH